MRVGVAGLGYWGPNLARNFDAAPGAELAWICDGSPEARSRWAPRFPDARVSDDFDELLADPTLDAVAIATPVPTHAPLALRALEAGKHCFVEKPLAQSVAEAESVVEAILRAGADGRSPARVPPRGRASSSRRPPSGDLGDIHYIYSNRLNLGKLRADENALWSLGAHDVSVVLRLTGGEEPTEAQAVGESYMRPGVEDVVFCYLRFPSGIAAHLHLSWLDPHKERRFTVVGSRRMATFDDMEIERKLTIYDKGFDQDFSSYGEYIARSGDIWSPRIANDEPLRLEVAHFVACVREGREPRSGARSGLRVRARCSRPSQRSARGKLACCGPLSARPGSSWEMT